MNRHINLRLAAAFLPLLFAAAVLAIAYATHGPAEPDGALIILSSEADAFQDHGPSHPHITGIQECRAGPSKCTGQPGPAYATPLHDQHWTLAPSAFAREIISPDHGFALEAPTYRMKPPPRAA